MAGLAFESNIYNCAIARSGLASIKAFMDTLLMYNNYKPDSYQMLYWKRFIGKEDRWESLSPLSHIDKISAPLLLIHGVQDEVIPYTQSKAMYEAMNRAGKSVELLSIENVGHDFADNVSRTHFVEAAVAFFLKHNPPT